MEIAKLAPSTIQALRWIQTADDPVNVEQVRTACRRIGLGSGGRVIDVGCGPLGALHVLAEIVEPDGIVVGIDVNDGVLQIARGILERRAFGQVRLYKEDVNTLDSSELGLSVPFDVGYCRLLLTNQTDPAATMRAMASLVRPGGHIIAHELLDDLDYPAFDPPVPAFRRLRELWGLLLEKRGLRPDAARYLSTFAEQANLRPVHEATFCDRNPQNAPAFLQACGLSALLAVADAVVACELAGREEILALATELQAATKRNYTSFSSWATAELIARRL